MDKKAYNREYSRKYRLLHSEKCKANLKAWRAANPDKRRKHVQEYRAKNPDRVKQSLKKWAQENKEYIRAAIKARDRRVKQATPLWAKRGFIMKNILAIYKNCPNDMSVDHIVPIQGKSVSGLHVPWNLQYMNPIENKKKGNKFFVELNRG